jgi:hypothetical protein
LHVYERLFYLPEKKNIIEEDFLHLISWEINKYDIDPDELKLNFNEEDKITSKIKQILSIGLVDRYDVFYLRNLRWKKWNYLLYEDSRWRYSKFFPDFIFWFINKKDEKDITLVYYEPKGESIDVNTENKCKKLQEIRRWEIDEDILKIFWLENDNSKKREVKWMGKIKIVWVIHR